MDFAMDFKAIWPLLRKEGWSWKPATGIQIHHNYLKPGSRLKTAKRGMDVFNGEDELLAYVRMDKELCDRLHIVNVMSTVVYEPVVSKRPADSSTSEKTPKSSKRAKKPASTKQKNPAVKEPATRKPKKKTKKQIADETNQQRRALAAFDKVWGEANSTVEDGTVVAVPQSNAVLTDATSPSEVSPEAHADAEVGPNANTDRISISGSRNADMDGAAGANNADIYAEVQECDDNDAGAGEDNDAPPSNRRVFECSEEEAYEPDDEEGEDESEDDGGSAVTLRDSEGKSEGKTSPARNDLKGFHDAARGTPLLFDNMDKLDPNIVNCDGDTLLASDEEGEEDFAEAATSTDVEPSDGEEDQDFIFRQEVNRIVELMDPAELQRLHMQVQASSEVFDDIKLDQMKVDGWEVLPENVEAEIEDHPTVDLMYNGYCGPSQDIIGSSKSPLRLFYYFLPKAFWRQVASQTNLYWCQTLEARLDKAVENEGSVTHRTQRSRETLRRNLEKFQKISPHEVVQWVGLMLGHALMPRKRMEDHWGTQEFGVIPAGTFGRVMSRDRFREISRFLHFTDNNNPASATDRAWKIRSILSTLETTFKEGYVLGSRVAIDEGMLPSHNKRNPTRTFMKNKPHRWGSKCVMTCCAETGYCKRVELDIGRADDEEGAQSMDTKNGPAAVIRNIACVFRGLPYEDRLLVIGDRFYTSIPLAQQLRTMGFNYVGTIQTDRKGWCSQLNYPKKKRRASTPRGTFQMAVARSNPGLVALMWADNTIVYFLASQVSAAPTTVRRRERGGGASDVPCPGIVAEYQRYMGGVDRHDQLRLQAYSMQLSTRFNKYYKSLFLGLVDMALVNAYIVYRRLWEKKKRKSSHFIFLVKLHEDLIKQSEESFTQTTGVPITALARPSAVEGDHKLVQTNDYRLNNNIQRLRQRQCKVCSCYKPADKSAEGRRRTSARRVRMGSEAS